ncbi:MULTISPECIES: hypothetical protein [Kitasatospora]|uniref:hypothetical protein n=1 Tax=Kitasatospora TaxID=2063 RepID=UPI000C70E88D|nr:hypothetical protein [Kitasatospora sp. GP30]MDH6141604.1 hypothetical protein [Kitasatospora sp. GP30]
MSLAQATFSELLQKPKDTVAKMDRAPRHGIRLTRRGDEDLYLTTAARAEQAVEIVDSTTRMFVALMRSEPKVVELLTKVFPEAFPWVRFLPAEAVREFLVELVDTAKASTALGMIDPIATVIAAWKHTAEAYSDSELFAALTTDTGEDYGPVSPPGMADE